MQEVGMVNPPEKMNKVILIYLGTVHGGDVVHTIQSW